MSKMDQTQFAKACGLLASAWNNISKSGDVFALGGSTHDGDLYVQMHWETMCKLFPDTRIEFFRRIDRESYPWEARIAVEEVKVTALLTGEQKHEAEDKEAE